VASFARLSVRPLVRRPFGMRGDATLDGNRSLLLPGEQCKSPQLLGHYRFLPARSSIALEYDECYV
jgi:hypothetical protein